MPEPFDYPDWLFELKWDGFRAVAYVEAGACSLVSRNGNPFKSFPGLCESVAAATGQHEAILDGEVVALDDSGRAQFYPLLYRRADPYFYAFDCLWLDGRDLRGLALSWSARRSYVAWCLASRPGCCTWTTWSGPAWSTSGRLRAEGIVAKHKGGVYDPDAPTWVKIKNRQYTQAGGRDHGAPRHIVRSDVGGANGQVRER